MKTQSLHSQVTSCLSLRTLLIVVILVVIIVVILKSDLFIKSNAVIKFNIPKPARNFYDNVGPYNNTFQNWSAFDTHARTERCVKRLPQAIVVGIQKCGTAAILTFLNTHPQIVACMDPMEVKFFSLHYSKGLDWYKNVMPCSYSYQVTMEKTPMYFYQPNCAKRIRQMNPITKIIITIKDPITRAQSQYAMLNDLKGPGKEMQPFEKLVTINNGTRVNTNTKLIRYSDYPKHIQPWLSNFKGSLIHIVDGHKLETDPAEELKRVERFLRIKPYFTPERFRFNETKGKYCLMSEDGDERCLMKSKGRKHPSLNIDTRKLLETYFRPKNNLFFKLIGKRLDWGY